MITVDTTEYVRVHGREPRGRGSWQFQFGQERELVGCRAVVLHPVIHFATPGQSYTRALDDARRLAVVREATTVKVLP